MTVSQTSQSKLLGQVLGEQHFNYSHPRSIESGPVGEEIHIHYTVQIESIRLNFH